ncbi:hypothetical protein ACLOJK_016595 [Asimina triloba]
MRAMGDEGEKTCPLCTEEMDLTDRQLRPCKCGYEYSFHICVWCWHQIMDMAEKDDTEGRCPACRTPYDKEKIVGMTVNCERLVAGINSERRQKSQKAKMKTSEGRKHLSNVRVIQRNLVYIIGIPVTLADEDTLERKEFFGQYGKVLKVSVSRPASGGQHSTNNSTCNVYITYSKEEEAVRCIQSVHGFSLEGRSLRACYGTTKKSRGQPLHLGKAGPRTQMRSAPTKGSPPDRLGANPIYFHASLGDATASNIVTCLTDCLGRAQIRLERHSGNILPPPVDDYCINAASADNVVKNLPNSVSAALPLPCVTPSLPLTRFPFTYLFSSAVRILHISRKDPPLMNVLEDLVSYQQQPHGVLLTVLFFFFLDYVKLQGLHVSSCWKPSSSVVNCQEHDLLKDDAFTSPSAVSTVAGNFRQASATLHAAGKTSSVTEETHNLSSISRPRVYSKQCIDSKNQTTVEKPSELAPLTNSTVNSEDLTREPSVESDLYDGARRNSHSILFSENSDCVIQVENFDYGQQKSSVSGQLFSQSPGNAAERSCQCSPEHGIGAVEHLTLLSSNESEGTCVSKELFDWRTEFQKHASPSEDSENAEVLLPVNEVLKLSEPFTSTFLLGSFSPSENSNHSSDHNEPAFSSGLSISSSRAEDAKEDDLFLGFTNGCTALSNGSRENDFNITTTESGKFCESNVEKLSYLGKSNGYTSIDDKIASLNLGESTIISNILSMDFDPWDGSLTHSFTELLKETDLQNGYCGLSNSHKPQDSSQSRFSFARQDDFMDQPTCLEPSSNEMEHLQKSSAVLDGLQNRESVGDRRLNGSIKFNFEDFQNPFSSHSSLVSNKASGPNRAFPPGFSSQQRMDHGLTPLHHFMSDIVFLFDSFFLLNLNHCNDLAGNQLSASASMPTNQHQLPPLAGNIGDAGDAEFIDPAILAVSKERFPLGGMSNSSWNSASIFQAQQTMPKNDARTQLLMQSPKSFHQNLQYSDCATDVLAHLNDAHIQTQLAGHLCFNGNGISPHYREHLSSFQQSRNLGMPNNPWDICNTIQSGANLAKAEILRNDIPDLDKYNSGYDELRFHRSTALGDLYSRAFGM